MSAILKRKGDYHNLIAYKKSVIIYDITFFFTQHFLQKGDRTIDQMLQAARSGKQNIAEGNRAAATSTETEIKLTNVAKASLEELLIDYQDYLRTRNKLLWDTSNPRYEKMRAYAASELIFDQYHSLLHKYNDEALANLCITLIHQTSFLLYRLLEKQEKNFLKEGGIKERMYQARLNVKNK
ncbi:four helix bundle suffix domain-containing protein [Capnocytophaga leadbetteri]|uniref:four helix bundle suffix domain-containing protein n=1 Tax=Capnocytophaga leadbetteri TaxID=327575 RepID=UPI0026F1EFCF|nr:four helix bundle suffix domain-containing protein [Capnocytophaga leadbetteri]